ncbi:Hypothetical predicted protein [Marmota monax]|uniref:Uncharacterized protein n=1 Tax=Marmota monax TaxID=9995 RepID=A0A5E4APZ5_MARMO|nr:hypothetical protein GHT09_013271 [Marmota monax]VTJ59235.1 Hypothetical predicted protein [Marmota monax]
MDLILVKKWTDALGPATVQRSKVLKSHAQLSQGPAHPQVQLLNSELILAPKEWKTLIGQGWWHGGCLGVGKDGHLNPTLDEEAPQNQSQQGELLKVFPRGMSGTGCFSARLEHPIAGPLPRQAWLPGDAHVCAPISRLPSWLSWCWLPRAPAWVQHLVQQ